MPTTPNVHTTVTAPTTTTTTPPPHALTPLLLSTLHLLLSTILYTPLLPLFLLLHTLLLPLHLLDMIFHTSLSTRPSTVLKISIRRLTAHAVLAPATRNPRTAALLGLFVAHTTLSVVLVVKVSRAYIPHVLGPASHPSSQPTSHPASHTPDHAHSTRILSLTLCIAALAPLCLDIGVLAGLAYYAGVYWRWGVFVEGMRVRRGGGGYAVELWEGGGGGGKRKGKEKEKKEKKEVRLGRETWEEEEDGWEKAVVYGGGVGGNNKASGFRDHDQEKRREDRNVPQLGKKGKGKAVADRASQVADRFRGGYDGREVRRRAWEGDVEMVEMGGGRAGARGRVEGGGRKGAVV